MNPDIPLLGFIGRLDYQKGVDLIRDNYDWLMSGGLLLMFVVAFEGWWCLVQRAGWHLSPHPPTHPPHRHR